VKDCDRDALPAGLRERFVPLPPDPHVEAFARGTAPYGALREATRRVLRRFVSDFDADGWLGTHPMALFGERSWEELVGAHRGGRLLDIGAGSGDVTVHARGLFSTIVTTETSLPMARRLRRRGLPCHAIDLAREPLPDTEPFDVVSLLNVLDRCDRPRALLRAARDRLAPRGQLLVSVPLPARPHVDVGSHTVDPDEPLGGHGERWEEALVDLVRASFEPLGLVPARIARTPYLSLGADGLHTLDAAVLVVDRA
jgi:SAM-dependent methyltransferase